MALLAGSTHRGCTMLCSHLRCHTAWSSRLACAHERSSGVASTSSSSGVQPAAGAAAPVSKGYTKRQRLDEYCLERHPQYSRNLIQSWIAQGRVTVNDRAVTKAGAPVPRNATISIQAEEPRFVCRAGYKLEAALDAFGVDVTGLVALDSGLSTGGFTDCLLQRGAAKVYGVDVGYGQVNDRIRRDERVVLLERTNLRYLRPQDIADPVALGTLDLSFISVLKVLPALVGVLAPRGAQLVVLIKPQFEAGRQQVSAGGVVRDPKVHQEVIKRICAGIEDWGFGCRGVIESPLKGDRAGNTEFLAHFVHEEDAPPLRATAGAAGTDAAAGARGRTGPGPPAEDGGAAARADAERGAPML